MSTNLHFINQTQITSGVTTVNVDNVFSDAYDVYFCQVTGVYHDTDVSNGIEGYRLIDSSGNVVTQSEYDSTGINFKTNTSFSETRLSNSGQLYAGLYTDQLIDGQASSSFYIFNPYDANSYTFMISQSMGANSSGNWGSKFIAIHKSAEIIRGFQFYESNAARTFGGGKINVYGVK